ncbi:hypothetical protein CBG46_10465 [Actinobacillus succinogenes]|uniref:RND efflux system, outer membrane lipoprotein, NodT family n=1 Tax=Actinobacillus succinogenes (strain ATCC 55618 / DSM 22257 / CCUG 43843 / 130Z) TaxID=339671 RepID=A6VNF8_ACTSZ|nr:efflux transporter outer membrane subunit [Actinobacillus succinogenes]ABR74505.1 RND efflux system, outer membrane lipoprotein, NodT family [Actinobacillus succinogenes 130Z]PHI41077.1 hypothetical protein CBG46_10465 [Actinobacillus succinogenes]
MQFIYKLSLIAVAVTLTACSNTEVDLHSQIDLPANFEQTGNGTGTADVSRWWRQWHDPQLTRLIEQGLRNNLDIAMARSRLNEAQANTAYTEADKGPQVSGSGRIGGSRSRLINSPLTGENDTSSGNNQYAGITASWELDFFGKKRSDADAAKAAETAVQNQIYATRMLIAGQIAENYFNIFALQQQNAVLNQSVKVLSRLRNYVQGRFNAGQANANDVLQVENRLTAVQAQQATLNSQIAANERAIAVLTGQTPQGFRINKNGNPLVTLPSPPAGMLPGDLLNRRPDLRVDRAQIQAAAAKLASAKADLYPRFDIQFMGGTGRIEINSDISELKGWTGLLSGGLSVPIFTNGRIQANIDAADARLKTALLQYDKTLIQALADVDNAYQAQYALNRQAELQQSAVKKAQVSAANAEKLFKYGDKNLDNALTERLNALDYQNQLIQVRLNRAKNLVNLYKALGGGWQE